MLTNMKPGQLLYKGNTHLLETYQTLCFYGTKQLFSVLKAWEQMSKWEARH